MTTATLTRPLRLGTRGSALAVAQSQKVAALVREATGRQVELVEIVTPGDRSNAPVARLGVGVFVSALRDALLAGQIDLAVHSYKDLPTQQADGLVIAAVPEREDPRDVLVSRDGASLATLLARSGVRIGTGAPRRIAQLLAAARQQRTDRTGDAPGVECVPIRGNVDTRLRRVLGPDPDLDAVVLARAGLSRLGRADVITEVIDPDLILPAPAQGALAVECRAGDTGLAADLAAFDHPATRAAVTAERALLAELQAGCSAPVGALATVTPAPAAATAPTGPATHHDSLHLRGAVIAVDGGTVVRMSDTGTLSDADSVGRRLAAALLDAGADSLLGSTR